MRGIPGRREGTIGFLSRATPQDRRRVVVTERGARMRDAVRGHRVAWRRTHGPPDTIWSVVRCEPITGRTHQIRVHLAALGCPIVGDATYGEPHDAIARQALHAWRVSLLHPVTRERLQLEAPLPRDMRALLAEADLRPSAGLQADLKVGLYEHSRVGVEADLQVRLNG